MFNTQHIIYMVVSFLITAGLLVVCYFKIKDQKYKNLILSLSAIITVIIHYSSAWVEFFETQGSAVVEANFILPVYPCNVVMWMLLASSLIKNKQSVIFNFLAEFCFYGGIVCGVIGIVFNANFDANPTLADYYVLKGLLSHSTMLFGCIYMLVGKFIKIRVFNALSVTVGLAIFVICGLVVNGLYSAFGMTPPDGMFLISNPYFNVSPMILGIIAVLLMWGVLALYELRLPKQERWYSKLKTIFDRNKNSKEKI